jgi:hypothetical protein
MIAIIFAGLITLGNYSEESAMRDAERLVDLIQPRHT